MKKIVSVLLLSSISFIAHSMDMKKVVGNYQVDKLNCSFAVDEVQISMARDRTGRDSLDLHFAGIDPMVVKLELFSSRKANFKFPLRSPVRFFITKVERGEVFLKNTFLEELGNRQQILRGEKSLQVKDGRLVYRQRKQGVMETCVLTR